jgi:hypothetical protein
MVTKFWQTLAAAAVLGGLAPAAIAQETPETPETFDEPAVVEEEPLFFDANFGPQLAAYVPLGASGAAGLLGFEATKYVGWPVYLGAAAFAGAHVGPAGTGFVGYGGPKLGLIVRLRGFALEPSVLVGGIYAPGPAVAGTGAVVQPELTTHLDLTDDFTLRLGAGYLFSPTVPALAGPTVKVGMSF